MKGKYSVVDVSSYIIFSSKLNNNGVSNLRLQKLLYYVQAEFLLEQGVGAFKEEIEAWDFGPVVPEVYHMYKMFGREDIVYPLDMFIDSVDKIEQNDRKIIDDVLNRSKNIPTMELVNMTHQEEPWIDAYNRGAGSTNIISKEKILEYFSKNS